jgi:hypothetical protein
VRVLLAVAPFFPLWQRRRWSTLHPGEPPSPSNYAARVVPFALLCVLAAVVFSLLGSPVKAGLSVVVAMGFCWLAFHYQRQYKKRHTPDR